MGLMGLMSPISLMGLMGLISPISLMGLISPISLMGLMSPIGLISIAPRGNRRGRCYMWGVLYWPAMMFKTLTKSAISTVPSPLRSAAG